MIVCLFCFPDVCINVISVYFGSLMLCGMYADIYFAKPNPISVSV